MPTLFLFPGDAPMGFRLPLQSLPWAEPASIDQDVPADPFAPQWPLPPHPGARATRSSSSGFTALASPDMPRGGFIAPVPQDAKLTVGREAPDVVRTALTVQPRDGKIHVFLPPLYAAEDWLRPWSPPSRTRRRASARRSCWKATRPPRDARPQPVLRDAGSRRDRGQHPPRRELGRDADPHRTTL